MNGPSATSDPRSKAFFTICGLPKTKKAYRFNTQASNEVATHQELDFKKNWKIEAASRLYFHAENEECYVQRPLRDLFQHWRHEWVEAETYCIHIERDLMLDQADGGMAAGEQRGLANGAGADAELDRAVKEATTV